MNIRHIVSLGVAAAVMAAFAEVDEDTAKEIADEASRATAQAAYQSPFKPLPLCRVVHGAVEVKKPGSAAWQTAEEGRFYPLGSSFRTTGQGRLEVAFGPESAVTISGDASFSTRAQKIGDKSRTIVLGSGEMKLDLPRNLKEGLFFVTAPGFTVKNPAGTSLYTYTDKGDGDEATVKCVTGVLALDGRHFKIPQMHAADMIRIRTSHDLLGTFLYGESGDYVVELDQGEKIRNEFNDDGSITKKVEKGVLKWNLSPETKVRIGRMVPSVGERMSVAVMTFDASGEMKNHFAFAEGRAEVNTGELVSVSKEEKAAIAKRAAEATETAAADAVEESPAADAVEETAAKEDKQSDDTKEDSSGEE